LAPNIRDWLCPESSIHGGVREKERTLKTTYKIDPAHSSAQFTIRHMMITNVRGSFSGVTGTVVLDTEDHSVSSVDATIDATTLSTNDAQRDGHVKSAEFLDVEKYPTITFKSTKVEATGAEEAKVTGQLTIHGATQEVVLTVEGPTAEAKDPWGNFRIGAAASTKIKRTDFGLTWSAALETGGVLLGDDLKIDIDVSLIKQAE
jgi:polyisoprenoid-binding protein YceI